MFKYENPRTSVEIVKAYNYLIERKESMGNSAFMKKYSDIWYKIKKLYDTLSAKQQIDLEGDDYKYEDLTLSQLIEFNKLFEYVVNDKIKNIMNKAKNSNEARLELIKLYNNIDEAFKNDLSELNSDRFDLEERYKEYNSKYFNNSLPVNLVLKWNGRLKNKLGLAFSRVEPSGVMVPTKIEMTNKAPLLYDALTSVLVHEMIHIYNYLHNYRGHGDAFRSVAIALTQKYPELRLIDENGKVTSLDDSYFKHKHYSQQKDFKIIPTLLYLYKPNSLYSSRKSHYRFYISSETDLKNTDKTIKLIIKNLSMEGFGIHEVVIYKIEINSPDFIGEIYTNFINKYRPNIGYRSDVINNIVNSQYSKIVKKVGTFDIINLIKEVKKDEKVNP